MRRAALVAALFVGCYRPKVESCQLACAADHSCPDGLSCSAANRCVAQGDQCGGVVPDGPPPPFLDTGTVIQPCDFTVTNVSEVQSVCDLLGGAATSELDVGGGFGIVTGMAGAPVVPPPNTFGAAITSHGVELVVIIVAKLVIGTGAQLAVSGDRPLVLISLDDIDIRGDLDATPGTVDGADCGEGQSGNSSGAGGGGGGYGTAGAAGGQPSIPLPVTNSGGLANGVPTLVPLRPGCNGGAGFGKAGSLTGQGGHGGTAVELAARVQLHVESTGAVRANGEIGGGNSGAGNGAGGGGSGGSIFLESALITLESNAALCANGGAGGSTTENGVPFGPGTGCTRTPSPPVKIGIYGGQGGAADGGPGAGQSASSLSGAGGGGGGVGRIRIHGPLIDLGASISPDAIEN